MSIFTKSQFNTYLESQIKYNQGKLDTMTEQLKENLTYYLSWNVESMYMLSTHINELSSWGAMVEELGGDDEAVRRFMEIKLESYRQFLNSEYNVLGTSTNPVSNLCVAWRYKVILDLKKTLESLS
jgi:hypothetical protein